MGQKCSAQERDLQSIDRAMSVKLTPHSPRDGGPVRSRPWSYPQTPKFSLEWGYSPLALPPNFADEVGGGGIMCLTTVTVPDNQLDTRQPQARPVGESLAAKPAEQNCTLLSPLPALGAVQEGKTPRTKCCSDLDSPW